MPSQEDLDNFNRLRGGAAAVPVIPKRPKLPEDVTKRFPSLQQYAIDDEEWRKQVNLVLFGTVVNP